jgi:LSU ribosomal protein L6P
VKFGKNMSKIGRRPIQIPKEVEIEIKGNLVLVKGPKGVLEKEFPKKSILK